MHSQVYHSHDIQAWEQRWFVQQNSAYGLMQQVAWAIVQKLIELNELKHCAESHNKIKKIAVCCGVGNNAGDGYLVAKYLSQQGFDVDVYAAERGKSDALNQAYREVKNLNLNIFPHFNFQSQYDVMIDALFGIGLNRQLSDEWLDVIESINRQSSLKISLDIPSGLHPDTGRPLTQSVKADHTFTALGLKAGLFTGLGKEYAGQIHLLDLIPKDVELQPVALLSPQNITLPSREAFGHKGSYGHVLVVGGHAEMGGAVMMAAESAFSSGAGKVTIACHAKHHTSILARSPNIMIKDIEALSRDDIQQLIQHVDAICFGMGLGRDDWGSQHYLNWFGLLNVSNKHVVLDADALWFLAQNPVQLNQNIYSTPHPGEAATLLNQSTLEIESDRIASIHALQEKYKGEWVLKGAGSLTLNNDLGVPQLWICTAGNAGMGTGGMGDVLAGMIASLKAQFNDDIQLHEIVTLHALAGDELAKNGMRGLQAHQMHEAIYHVVND